MRARASRRRLLAAGAACALVGAAGPWFLAPARAQESLRLAFIPQENPEKLLDDINAATVQVVNLVVNNRSKIHLDESQAA